MKETSYNNGKSRSRGTRFFTKRNTFTDMKLNDFENDLHIMNFKLNCDILQHKLSRLNSLIKVNDMNAGSLNSFLIDDDQSANKLSTSLNTVNTVNIVNTYNTLNRISTPSGLKTRNMKNLNFPPNSSGLKTSNLTNLNFPTSNLDSLQTNTNDILKCDISEHSPNKEDKNFRYNDKIKHLIDTNFENSKIINMGESNDSYENAINPKNQRYVNNNQARPNQKSFKRNKNLVINTSTSSQYLAESVQRFCITPVAGNRLNMSDTTDEVDENLPQFAINHIDKMVHRNNLSSNIALDNSEDKRKEKNDITNTSKNSQTDYNLSHHSELKLSTVIKNEIIQDNNLPDDSSSSADLSNIAENLVNFIQDENEVLDLSTEDKLMNTGRLVQELKGSSYTTVYDASQSIKNDECANSELLEEPKITEQTQIDNYAITDDTPQVNNITEQQSSENVSHPNEADQISNEIIPEFVASTENSLKEQKIETSNPEQEEETDEDADRIINEIIKNSKSEQTKNMDKNVAKDMSPVDNINEAVNESRNITQLAKEQQRKNKVYFGGTTALIGYNEKDIIKNLYISKGEGKYDKFKNTDFKNYLKTLRSKCAPKSILKAKDEKSLALEKLNDLILECGSGTLDEKGKRTYTSVSKEPPTEIMVRNIKKVQEIETMRKQGVSYRKIRVPTPRKPKKIEVCGKFKKNPGKFFSEPLCDLELRSLEIRVDDNLFRSTDFNSNLNSSTQPFESDSIAFMNRVCRSVELSPQQKEGKLKEYISNITIQGA